MEIEVVQGDRRSHRRTLFELPIRFQYTDKKGVIHAGCGSTVELGRGGIRFKTLDPLPVGALAEGRIAWPFRLQGICPLELVVKGSVIRSDAHGAVMRLRSYEFHTCGERSFSEVPEKSAPWRVA